MLTYCNPLPIKNIPSGKALDTFQEPNVDSINDYRSIADPSVVYHNGMWIMYPSYSVAYVTKDFVNWEHIDIGVPDLRYSPAIVEFKGKWYLCGHQMSELYCSDNPLGPFELCGNFTDINGKVFRPVDACFLADGDRLYLYFHHYILNHNKDVERLTCTKGVELNPDKPWQFITEPVVINEFNPDTKWQRMGEHNENKRMGWIEGQWMKKIGSRYYLLYSASGTHFGSYANGVAYSDEGPLSGFVNQKHNDPLSIKKHGLMRGAGHGCIADGPDGTLWLFYTCLFNYNHKYERRIGMDPLGIDENGELYCPQVTDTPQFAPGVLKNPEKGNSAGLLPLTFMCRPQATSCAMGRDAIYACDDSVLTWWQPADDDKTPEIIFTLGNQTGYDISSVRIIWRDIGMDTNKGIIPGPFRYIIEYSPDSINNVWKTLIDASENTDDLCIDYRQFEKVTAYALKLKIIDSPKGITPGLVSLTAFGTCSK